MANSHSLFKEKKESSSSSKTTSATQEYKISNTSETKSEEKNEALPVDLPKGVDEIFLHYLGGDIELTLEDKKAEWYFSEQTQTFALSNRSFLDLMHHQAALVASLILRGEEADVAEAIKLINENPDLLRYHTIVKDSQGRLIKGTPLQIAIMAGDIDLRAGIENEEEHGIAERLILAGNLSEDEIAEQIECMTSEKAKEINRQRNQRVLDAIIRFGEAIIESKADFKSPESYEPLVNQFIEDIKPDTKGIITKGYIFDPKIISDTIKWFASKAGQFGGWTNKKSDIFWVKGIGNLENLLSARETQLFRANISNLINHGRLPPRTSDNTKISGLGNRFYLASDVARPSRSMREVGITTATMLETLSQIKSDNIPKLTQYSTLAKKHAYALR